MTGGLLNTRENLDLGTVREVSCKTSLNLACEVSAFLCPIAVMLRRRDGQTRNEGHSPRLFLWRQRFQLVCVSQDRTK
jgi:hypothetical protein